MATGRKPVVLHFDHGWRAESGGDAAFVKEQARKLRCKYIGGKMRKSSRGPREADARAARYAFFARTARRLGIPHLVLAHHADDQVETFLLQLLRGSGAAARGMDGLSRREGLTLHRPWLGVWKREIVVYARRHKLTWREDATNADTRHRRNLLRRRVVPYLEKQFGPAVTENLFRAAEIARAESEWFDALCVEEARKPELMAKPLRESPLAQQRRTILRWLQRRGLANISFGGCRSGAGSVGESRAREDQPQRRPIRAPPGGEDFCGVKGNEVSHRGLKRMGGRGLKSGRDQGNASFARRRGIQGERLKQPGILRELRVSV